MVQYTIDTNPRLTVYFALATISASVVSALAVLEGSFLFKIAAPSVLMVFLALVRFFDHSLWKFPLIHGMVKVPNLEGTWQGTLVRSAGAGTDETTTRSVTLSITQNWQKISLVFLGEHSRSHAEAVAMFVEDPRNVTLKWIYFSRDVSGTEDEDLYGVGTTELTLKKENGNLRLIGYYYSSQLREGSIDMERISTQAAAAS